MSFPPDKPLASESIVSHNIAKSKSEDDGMARKNRYEPFYKALDEYLQDCIKTGKHPKSISMIMRDLNYAQVTFWNMIANMRYDHKPELIDLRYDLAEVGIVSQKLEEAIDFDPSTEENNPGREPRSDMIRVEAAQYEDEPKLGKTTALNVPPMSYMDEKVHFTKDDLKMLEEAFKKKDIADESSGMEHDQDVLAVHEDHWPDITDKDSPMTDEHVIDISGSLTDDGTDNLNMPARHALSMIVGILEFHNYDAQRRMIKSIQAFLGHP